MALISNVSGSTRVSSKQFLDAAQTTANGYTASIDSSTRGYGDTLKLTGGSTTGGGSAYVTLNLASPVTQFIGRMVFEYGEGTVLTGTNSNGNGKFLVAIDNSASNREQFNIGRFFNGNAYFSMHNGATLTAYRSTGGLSSDVGEVGEFWFGFKIDGSDSNGFFAGAGSETTSILGLSTSGDVESIQIGIIAGSTGGLNGTIYIHELEIWDSRPTDLIYTHEMAGLEYVVGCPGVVDISGTTGKTPNSLTISVNGGAAADIWVPSLNGTRDDPPPGTLPTAAELSDSTNITEDNEYDGCLIVGTADPCSLAPMKQICQVETLTVSAATTTKAYLVEPPPWIYSRDTSYVTNGQAHELQTYTVFCATEVTTGVYRVGIPGSALTETGTALVTLGFTDASSISKTITIEPVVSFEPRTSWDDGEFAVYGYDDSINEHAGQHRSIWAARDVSESPYSSFIVGTAGSSFSTIGWRVARLLSDAGWDIFNHLWTSSNLSLYTTTSAQKILAITTNIMRVHGYEPEVFVAPNGQTSSSEAASLVSYILGLGYVAVRGSTTNEYNNLPLSLPTSTALNARSLYNNSSTSTVPAEEAAEAWDVAQGRGGAGDNTFYGFNYHNLAKVTTSTTITHIEIVRSMLDESDERLITTVRLSDMLVVYPEPEPEPEPEESESITRTTPISSRGTRLTIPDSNATETQWDFIQTHDGYQFFITTSSGTHSATNVLNSSVSYVELWLPPFFTYYVRYRQKTNGVWGAWAQYYTFTSRGPLNSYDAYYALNSETSTFANDALIQASPGTAFANGVQIEGSGDEGEDLNYIKDDD